MVTAPSLDQSLGLPTEYVPHRVKHFDVQRIILSKGSLETPARKLFARGICAAYPKARVEEHLDTPHNRIRLSESDPLKRLSQGKKTLVLGELDKSLLRHRQKRSTDPPDYWYFSIYGHCPYGCSYCWLAGTKGVWYSPTVKIYVNLPEIMDRISREACRTKSPTGFHVGRFHDGLALDPLTAYSTVLVPFFARHKYARQIVLTKSDAVERLLDLEHGGNTILTWSLNPPEVVRRFEVNVPSVEARINAMQKCVEKGYPVRASIEPVIPDGEWEAHYTDFIRDLLSRVPLQRLYLGKLYMCPNALYLTQRRMGKDNAISRSLANERRTRAVGRSMSVYLDEAFRKLAHLAKNIQPGLEIGYCSML